MSEQLLVGGVALLFILVVVVAFIVWTMRRSPY
jgi:hypothetical protein